jgi:hypothetical protein
MRSKAPSNSDPMPLARGFVRTGLCWPRGLATLSKQDLAQRRTALQSQSALLRESLAVQALALQVAPSGWSFARRAADLLRRHPWAPALAAGVLLWRRPRHVLRWALRSWGWWRLGRRLVSMWKLWRPAQAR